MNESRQLTLKAFHYWMSVHTYFINATKYTTFPEVGKIHSSDTCIYESH